MVVKLQVAKKKNEKRKKVKGFMVCSNLYSGRPICGYISLTNVTPIA